MAPIVVVFVKTAPIEAVLKNKNDSIYNNSNPIYYI
jgi:hypothetical protein